MIRRRLIIEWDDYGTDTDEDCRNGFIAGDWTIQDLEGLDYVYDEEGCVSGKGAIGLKVWVEDAPKEQS